MSIANGYILPNELLQAIFLLLDFESFYHAARVCRLWRDAALNLHILRRQVQGVPCLRRSDCLKDADGSEVEIIFNRICRKNLIGLRNKIESTSLTTESSAAQIGSIPVRSRHAGGLKYAKLQGMTLSLYTPSKAEPQQITLSPSLYPSPETVQKLLSQGQTSAFFSSRSFAQLQVGVSGCGGLVAVALGVNVHVYILKQQDGEQDGKQKHTEVTISSDITDSVQRVEFVEEDQLLRVEVDGREGSYVRYLGFRKCSCSNRMRSREPVSVSSEMKLKYWTVALRRVHLDSRSIEEGLGRGISTRGMRLLPPRTRQPQEIEDDNVDVQCRCRSETNFFTLLRQPGCKNTYAVGTLSTPTNAPAEVKITQQIPSRAVTPADIKSYFQFQPVLREGRSPSPSPDGSGPGSASQPLDRFDEANLPQAHSIDPLLTVSDDGKVLAIYEQPHGQTKGAMYLCSRDDDNHMENKEKASVEAWPFVLSTADQSIHSLWMAADRDGQGYIVQAGSQRHEMQWKLRR
ncbi:F-box protein [Aspergillus stella-maris]|uniref:F-box protein n=1 Tax=Aspergillus stella-maris TaxID=1810926 RepID=UPI003CCD6FA2